MPSSSRLQHYGICTLLLGVLLTLYGCEGDPQAKKARYMQKGLTYMVERKYTAAVLEFKNAVQLTTPMMRKPTTSLAWRIFS